MYGLPWSRVDPQQGFYYGKEDEYGDGAGDPAQKIQPYAEVSDCCADFSFYCAGRLDYI